MNLRGENIVFRAALLGAIGSFALACSTLSAAAADDPTAPAPIESVYAGRSDVVAMAPIPDVTPSRANATPGDASGANPRMGMIIQDGVVTMIDPDHISLTGRTDDAGELATAPLRQETCLAKAIYFEARGESMKGQEAVAAVVLARTKAPGRPKSICGVVYEGSRLSTGCQFSFTCDGIADVVRNTDAWTRALRIASRAMRGKFKAVARGATYFHASYVRPNWASHMIKVAQIGTHIFYRP